MLTAPSITSSLPKQTADLSDKYNSYSLSQTIISSLNLPLDIETNTFVLDVVSAILKTGGPPIISMLDKSIDLALTYAEVEASLITTQIALTKPITEAISTANNAVISLLEPIVDFTNKFPINKTLMKIPQIHSLFNPNMALNIPPSVQEVITPLMGDDFFESVHSVADLRDVINNLSFKTSRLASLEIFRQSTLDYIRKEIDNLRQFKDILLILRKEITKS